MIVQGQDFLHVAGTLSQSDWLKALSLASVAVYYLKCKWCLFLCYSWDALMFSIHAVGDRNIWQLGKMLRKFLHSLCMRPIKNQNFKMLGFELPCFSKYLFHRWEWTLHLTVSTWHPTFLCALRCFGTRELWYRFHSCWNLACS